MDYETCGYCGGAGRVCCPRFDGYDFRREVYDDPDTQECPHCEGRGECENGHDLPARDYE